MMGQLKEYVDVCIANEEDAEKVFGIKAASTDVTSGRLDHDGFCDVAKQLAKRFGCKYVAITLRTSLSASDNKWAAMLYNGEEALFSREYLVHIVDRVGGGDSFGGGLIYGLYTGMDDKEAGICCSGVLPKHTVEGDFNRVSVKEVQALAGGDGSGRVQR